MTSTRIYSSSNTDLHLRVAPLFNDTVVGFEGPTDKLLSWALEKKQRAEVMFVEWQDWGRRHLSAACMRR